MSPQVKSSAYNYARLTCVRYLFSKISCPLNNYLFGPLCNKTFTGFSTSVAHTDEGNDEGIWQGCKYFKSVTVLLHKHFHIMLGAFMPQLKFGCLPYSATPNSSSRRMCLSTLTTLIEHTHA